MPSLNKDQQTEALVAYLKKKLEPILQQLTTVKSEQGYREIVDKIFLVLSNDPKLPRKFNEGTEKHLYNLKTFFLTNPPISNHENPGIVNAGSVFFGVLFISFAAWKLTHTSMVDPIVSDFAWTLIGIGTTLLLKVLANTALDGLRLSHKINCADDCAMIFIKELQSKVTEISSKQGPSGGILGLINNSPNQEISSLKNNYKSMLESLKEILPEDDKVVFEKAIKVIEDGSYENIQSKEDLNAIVLNPSAPSQTS